MSALLNALQVIQQKDDTTPLDDAILFYGFELPPERKKEAIAAAEELDDLVDTIGNLREALEKSDTELTALRKELQTRRDVNSKDGVVIMEAMKKLGLDVSGAAPEDIVTAIVSLRKELEEAKAEIERMKREHNPALQATSTAADTVTELSLDKWMEE